ncbi:MAG: glycosyltransferase [Lachnospiraceae bacterium]|nr:glycosyltransferase [Lachnospiraceae bacterium]
MNEFDSLIVTTAKDYDRVCRNYPRLVRCLPGRDIIFIGSGEVEERLKRDALGERVRFLNENDVIPFDEIDSLMRELTGADEVPRGMSGWYYQQFLKMSYSYLCDDGYYMTWDGDTIPCKGFSMFVKEGPEDSYAEQEAPLFDLKQEYCEYYFTTLEKLFPGMRKCIPKSFISEHMLFKKEYMIEMIEGIEVNGTLEGEKYYEKILRVIGRDRLKYPSFSEFETYGTYTCLRHMGSYRMRNWHSFRYCGNFFDPDTINEEDYEWLGRDFDAVSFEKRAERTPESMEIFSKKEYREKLSARQILEIVQEESEGYKEEW